MVSVSRKPASGEREAPRVSVEAFVKISGADREFVLRTRDLSESGLFLYTKVAHIYPFRVGSTLNLELYDFDCAVTCTVVVVRVVEPGSKEADDYPTGFGVKITEITPEARQQLRTMIEQGSQAGALY